MRSLMYHVRVRARWAGMTSTAKAQTKKLAKHLAIAADLYLAMLLPCARFSTCSGSGGYEVLAGLDVSTFHMDFLATGATSVRNARAGGARCEDFLVGRVGIPCSDFFCMSAHRMQG